MIALSEDKTIKKGQSMIGFFCVNHYLFSKRRQEFNTISHRGGIKYH